MINNYEGLILAHSTVVDSVVTPSKKVLCLVVSIRIGLEADHKDYTYNSPWPILLHFFTSGKLVALHVVWGKDHHQLELTVACMDLEDAVMFPSGFHCAMAYKFEDLLLEIKQKAAQSDS